MLDEKFQAVNRVSAVAEAQITNNGIMPCSK
jgi:hypothetical protein